MKIDINTALHKLNDSFDFEKSIAKTYGFKVLNSRGEVSTLLNVRKNVKLGTAPSLKNRNPKGRSMYHLKEHGTILLFDVNTQEHRSVKKACIFGFRDYKSNDFIEVFH